jgi:hypothetical protein
VTYRAPVTTPSPVPEYGYEVPASAYPIYRGDPLVTPPAEGFAGWSRRLVAMVRRNWRRIITISLVTYAVPLGVLAALAGLAAPRIETVVNPDGAATPHVDMGSVGRFLLVVFAGAIVIGYLNGVAGAAAVWSVTRDAVGQPAPLADALRYGLRNGPRLWGWTLLYSLIVTAGFCACVLPGVYVAVAGCLYVPIALYERGNGPISTSFSMVNRNYFPALGRMIALVGLIYAVRLVLSVPILFVTAANRVVGQVLSGVVDVVTAPLTILVTLGTVVLYAELRARNYPITSASLAAAL